ncbi:uncharacterized protein LOC129230214 [Uloborus diversus]|uniref:uncharacterized protein LOC129230214 n=1 Tax=Uloborus diversus TaxID=327109 RepID=UPI00240A7598|nr:uncharacterized protein LOC129230214 [Uloborus diversus]
MVLHFLTGWLLLGLSTGDPIEFDPFFAASDTSYFSPQEGPFGAFSGFSFGSSGARFDSDFQESPSLPVYRDGVATPPQVTLSRLEKDYKAQLHRVAQAQVQQQQQRRLQQSSRQGRKQYPVFQSDPYPSASNIDERKPARSKEAEKPQTTLGPNSKPVEVHTGFTPIIKSAAGQERRLNSQSLSSAVIKDMEPPILTAASVLSSRPTLFKVSASVLSSAKAPALRSLNESANVDLAKSRKISYSRFLDDKSDNKSLVFSGESVAARVASGSQVRQQVISPIGDEAKLVAKKTLDINCDGSRDLGWCELGDKYPKKYVDQVLSSCQDVIQRMHVEVPHSFEKLSDNSNFKAELDNSQRSARERGNHDAWSWAAYFHQGSLCDAETGFLRPETAKDSSGKWNIIVQTDAIKQRVPIEMCRKANGPCKKTTNCGLKSQCLQKYNYHLLMSLNPTQKHDCPFMKLYRFPSACVCHVE